MKNLSLELFKSDEIVSPYRTMRMFEALRRNVERTQARRYYHTACRIPFDDIDNTDGSAEKQIYIRPPFDVNIDFVELRVYGTADKVFTVSATGVNNWTDISVTADGSTFVETLLNNQCNIDANTECVFTISAESTWAITSAELILHIRKDRGNAATSFNKPQIKSGAASQVSTELNTPFTDYATLASQESALSSGGTFAVNVFRNITGLTNYSTLQYKIAATGQYVLTADCYLVASGTDSWGFVTQNPSASFSLTAAGTGSTVSSQGNTMNHPLYDLPTVGTWDYTNYVTSANSALVGEKLYFVTYFT